MAYADSLLAEGEHLSTAPSSTRSGGCSPVDGGLVLVGGIALLILLVFLGTEDLGDARTLAFWGSLILLVVGVVMIGWNYVAWYQEDYLITNQKVMKVAGLLNKKSSGSPSRRSTTSSWSRVRSAGCSTTAR